ncbi:hypothetical protein Dimus_016010 [Dionaea muscipula]
MASNCILAGSRDGEQLEPASSEDKDEQHERAVDLLGGQSTNMAHEKKEINLFSFLLFEASDDSHVEFITPNNSVADVEIGDQHDMNVTAVAATTDDEDAESCTGGDNIDSCKGAKYSHDHIKDLAYQNHVEVEYGGGGGCGYDDAEDEDYEGDRICIGSEIELGRKICQNLRPRKIAAKVGRVASVQARKGRVRTRIGFSGSLAWNPDLFKSSLAS